MGPSRRRFGLTDCRHVILGLGGDLPSAVAAHLLRREGYRVTGVHLDASPLGAPDRRDAARAAADALELPLIVLDVWQEMARQVCAPFREGCCRGGRGVPCALCNEAVRFPALLRLADELNARWIATGHGVRVTPEGRLRRGVEAEEPSYFLGRLPGETLRRCLFPLGERRRADVETLGAELGHPPLPARAVPPGTACFHPGGDVAAWVERTGPTPPPGLLLDGEGKRRGIHGGVHRMLADRRPVSGAECLRNYNPSTHHFLLGRPADLLTRHLWIHKVRWNCAAPAVGAPFTARFLHSRLGTGATLAFQATDGRVCLSLDRLTLIPPPEELVVLYDGDVVAGSGYLLVNV